MRAEDTSKVVEKRARIKSKTARKPNQDSEFELKFQANNIGHTLIGTTTLFPRKVLDNCKFRGRFGIKDRKKAEERRGGGGEELKGQLS